MSGKTFEGTVTSTKMTKTLVVTVSRRFQEKRTGKIVSTRKNYKVHNENTEVKPGDFVSFQECRPISKFKKFRMIELIKKAVQSDDVIDELTEVSKG